MGVQNIILQQQGGGHRIIVRAHNQIGRIQIDPQVRAGNLVQQALEHLSLFRAGLHRVFHPGPLAKTGHLAQGVPHPPIRRIPLILGYLADVGGGNRGSQLCGHAHKPSGALKPRLPLISVAVKAPQFRAGGRDDDAAILEQRANLPGASLLQGLIRLRLNRGKVKLNPVQAHFRGLSNAAFKTQPETIGHRADLHIKIPPVPINRQVADPTSEPRESIHPDYE